MGNSHCLLELWGELLDKVGVLSRPLDDIGAGILDRMLLDACMLVVHKVWKGNYEAANVPLDRLLEDRCVQRHLLRMEKEVGGAKPVSAVLLSSWEGEEYLIRRLAMAMSMQPPPIHLALLPLPPR